jgi:exopolysaccharide biosynthesis polyprenyl glycosylphosphotransferase
LIEEKTRNVGRVLRLLDMGMALIAFLVAYQLQITFGDSPVMSTVSYVLSFIFFTTLFSWGMSYAGAYRSLRIPMPTFAWVVASSMAFAMGALFAVLYMLQVDFLSRAFVLCFISMVLVLTVISRALVVFVYFRERNSYYFQKTLVIGTGSRAMRISELLKSYSEWGVDIIGYLDSNPEMVGKEVNGKKVLGVIEDIEDILKANVIDEVVVAVPRTMINDLGKIFASCQEEGIKLRVMSDLFDLQVMRMRLDILGDAPMLNYEPVAQDETALLVKRVFDLIMVLAAIPVLLPLLAIVALAIKLDSPGPVMFVQNRVGLRKRIFPMYKFRSMVVNSEEMLKDIEHLNEAEGPIFKISNDPRVTRVGRFIRKTSLDELPQLFNVLLGHMSLVGPRPMSIRDVDLFDSGIQRRRFSVRPGLTCLWQISGRSNLPFERWLELDLAYIDGWSFKLDLEILLKTIPVLIKTEGAV